MSSQLQLTPAQLTAALTAQWKEIIRQALIDLRVAAPAVVTQFNSNQTVNVQIEISELVRLPDGPQWTAIPPIYNVPIILPRAGGFSLTLPLKAGDEGLLVFCDSCIDLWWQQGGVQPPAGAPLKQPQFERRRHDLSDCGFIPGPWNQTRVLSNYSTDSAQLRSDDGTVIVDVAEAGITLTAPKVTINTSGDIDLTASGNVNISGTNVSIASDTTIDGKTFLTHTHTGVQSGGSDTGPVT
jgi:hypothetical protein